MNEPTIRLEVRPEVSSFVEKVRARLSDLSDEEREELVGGLEADIAELVSDGGSVSELGDPRAYADELRAAAGLERTRRRSVGGLPIRRPRKPIGRQVEDLLNGARARWLRAVAHPRLAASWDLAVALRPAWWVLRAWIAVQLLDAMLGRWEYPTPVPTLGGPVGGFLVLVVTVVLSVQLGRGRLWPTLLQPLRTWVRVGLVGLNALAVLALPLMVGAFPPANVAMDDGYHYNWFRHEPGLKIDNRFVQNVFAYDAQGNPLTGVQLFDERGEPLVIHQNHSLFRAGPGVQWGYPWVNGNREQRNVFPMSYRQQRHEGEDGDAWTSNNPPLLPQPPLAAVPPVALPSSAAPEPAAEPTDDAPDPATDKPTDEAAGRATSESKNAEESGER